MSDRVCIRGCVQRGVHYATCAWYGIDERVVPAVAALPNTPKQCTGCAPRECRDGSLICDRCFGRMRALLADGPDLVGRLHALADPMKATPTDQVRVASSSTEPPAPVSADLLDAIGCLGHLDPWWFADLASYSNDVEVITWLSTVILDRHPEIDGSRSLWSVQDAVDKWGVERRTKGQELWTPDADGELVAFPTPEWDDPIVGWSDAARIAGSDSTLRRWIRKEDVAVAGVFVIAGVRVRQFRARDLIATRDRLAVKKTVGLAQNAKRGAGEK